MLKVKSPEGQELEVSEKAFEAIYRQKGFTKIATKPAGAKANPPKKAEKTTSEPNEDDVVNPPLGFPEDFPAKDIFEEQEITLATVSRMSNEDLISIDGIGAKTAEKILEAVKKIYGEEAQ